MRFCVLLILVSAILAAPTSAVAKPHSTERNTRTCRIIFPERSHDAPKVAYLYDGKENHKIRLPSANFSKVIELPAGELIILMSPTEITDPTILPLATTQLKVEESVQDLYILVSSDPANTELPLKFRLINVNDEKICIGDTLWINSTEHQISAKLGEQDVAVSPKSETVSKSPVSTSGYYKAEFRYQPNAKGDFHKVTEQQWWHDMNSKHLGVIINSGGRLPKVYYYRDFRQ